jgi:uncharacterized membrane protein YjgN (DUF898 family)
MLTSSLHNEQMIRFPIFYASSQAIKDYTGQKPGAVTNFMLGGFAAVVSTIINTPFDTIKTRMQKVGSNTTTMGAIKQIVAEKGPVGLWAGTIPRMVRVVPGQAITFFVVELVLDLMGTQM